MKVEWVGLLRDPYDGSTLSLGDGPEIRDGRVINGILQSGAGRRYVIRDGIPILVSAGMQSQESVESFAFEWDEFGFLFAKNGWIEDVVRPLVDTPDFFRGKTVVDAGAGSGAQSRWIAESGADLVFSLELSDAIFSRHQQTIGPVADRVFPIQADIAYPPLGGNVDVVYCVNVAQHTADPRRTFRALARLVRRDGGVFLFNTYTKRSELKFQIVRAVRAAIRLLPFRAWKAGAWAITAVAYPVSRISFLKRLIKVFVPISHSFRETWLDVYDAFGPHWYQKNMRREDQQRMIVEEGLSIARESRFAYLLRPS